MSDVVKARMPNIIMFFVGLVLTILFWWPTVAHMASLIWNVDVFAHGQLVPLISIAMIWSRRGGLLQSMSFFPPASIVLLGSALVWLIGQFLDAAIFTHLALVTVIQGLVILCFGLAVYRRILFPMLFLYMMIPFGYAVIQPLQYLTANFVIDLLGILGVEHTADGVLIELKSGLYEVAEACAGVKFLFTSLVTGVLLANIVFNSWKRRLFILVISLILPILANVVRVLTILLIAEATDQSFAKDVDHIVYGWVFLSIVLFALISFAYWISDKDDFDAAEMETPSSVQSNNGLSILKMVVVGFGVIAVPVVGVLAAPAEPSAIRNHIAEPDTFSVTAPAGFRVLSRTSSLPAPFVTGVDTLKAGFFRNTSNVYNIYAGSIDTLRPGQRLYQPGFKPVSSAWDVIHGRGGQVDAGCGLQAQEKWFSNNGRVAMVWIVRLVGDQGVTSSMEEKLKVLAAQFSGRQLDGQLFVMSGQINGASVKLEQLDKVRENFRELLGFAIQEAGKELCVA